MSVRVKICGITNLEDALAAADAGADALGFIFFRGSTRFIEPASARDIIAKLPSGISKIGVFVDEPLVSLQAIASLAGLTAVQLHGNESPDFCDALSLQAIKAFRIKEESSLRDLARYQTSAFLLDSYVPGQLGGTGARFNWELAIEAKRYQRPIILAGGLTPENVADAVAKVQPYMVDVSSGVETSPGRKDHEKVQNFIRHAKAEAV